MTEQQREIKTIKPRTFCLNLSDADVERLYEKAELGGVTPEQLLESFIADLVDGTYSNGSDERMYANQWFERCDVAAQCERTFLAFVMSDTSYNGVEEMIQNYRDLIFWQSEQGRAYCSSERDWKAHIAALQCTLNNTYEKYVQENPDAKSFEEEMKTILDWQQRKADMLAGNPADPL